MSIKSEAEQLESKYQSKTQIFEKQLQEVEKYSSHGPKKISSTGISFKLKMYFVAFGAYALGVSLAWSILNDIL